jgi:uncharacterized protein Usg
MIDENFHNLLVLDNLLIDCFTSLYGLSTIQCRHCKKIVYHMPTVFKILHLQKYYLHKYDLKFTITSFYRCPEYNKSIGGAINSMHLQGRAVDIALTFDNIDEFIQLAFEIGFTTILYYPSKKFFHIDTRPREVYINKNYPLKTDFKKTTSKNGENPGLFIV